MDMDNIASLIKEKEGQLFDRKSARIQPKDLANCIMSFANADGGRVAVGIEDDGELTGFKNFPNKESDFREFIPKYIIPSLSIDYRKIPFDNNGVQDFILLVSVEQSSEMHKNQTGEVTLRRGRETCTLKFDEIQNLQYDKGLQRFESKKAQGATLKDLEIDLILKLGEKIKITDPEKILIATDLAERNGEFLNINLAGILLFGAKPQKWIERARIRIIKYEGIEEETGTNLNVVKDLSFEKNIISQLDESALAIGSLLRDFTRLDAGTKKFATVSEYPPLAWREGLINAVAHREYSLAGADIQIKIFEDRMEMISPGNFPSIVREDNIKETHFSRNPRIARVLGFLGYVKELGEGVNRIFEEMKRADLPDPTFKNISGNVIVTMQNNISHRELRKYSDLTSRVPKGFFSGLKEKDKAVILYVLENGKITKKELISLIKMSTGTAIGILKRLQETDPPTLLAVRKSPQDPGSHYILNPEILIPTHNGTTPSSKAPTGQGNLFWEP